MVWRGTLDIARKGQVICFNKLHWPGLARYITQLEYAYSSQRRFKVHCRRTNAGSRRAYLAVELDAQCQLGNPLYIEELVSEGSYPQQLDHHLLCSVCVSSVSNFT